ncbi:MAG: TSUP family transporter [Bacteriovoracaceae bacterium]
MIILSLITVFITFVSSLFGAGILVFGTPLMMLSGLTFLEASAFLYPLSFCISLKIVVQNRHILKNEPMVQSFLIFTLPLVLIFSFLSFSLKSPAAIKLIVSLFLLFAALLRLKTNNHERFAHFINSIGKATYLILGIVQGFSNMGATILFPFVGSKDFSKSKSRAIIAFCFVIFTTVQMFVLFLIKKQTFPLSAIFLILLGFFTSEFCERYFFHQMANKLYFHLLTVLMFCISFILLFQYIFA